MSALLFPFNVPVLTDGVVTLRAHTPDDVDPMCQMANDPQMRRWTAIPVPNAREDSERFALEVIPEGWNAGKGMFWAIEAEGRYAGNVDIRGDGPVTDIGFALHPWARGRGLMRRAVDLAVEYAFTEGGKEIVHWNAHVGNEASLRVAHACGFTLHGTQPGLLHERGRIIDAWTGSRRFGDPPVPRTRWTSAEVDAGPVRLRPYRESDAERLVEAFADPLLRHWLDGIAKPYTLADARSTIANAVWKAATGQSCVWVVADPETDDLLGNVSVMDLRGNPWDDAGEIGYWLHPDARGRGLMTAAVQAAVEYAFDPQGLDRRRLTCYAAAGNTASRRVASAAGFAAFGTQRAAERLGDGSYDDLVGYELLR
ncbi:N-acetyltransferase [Aeromicrobium camelliae]|uniref:N-acetyltransferase n=1 Tax=Aeromicrobium camelliae TaxID=1538144 RepID=A0A3N6ZDQ7_9ACTN|nr:GNAT family N-acetyltransferase [Aeromicrobium camelliae]RQN08311.1 N-acetyltransferase [Aeromicrobium camelliae]